MIRTYKTANNVIIEVCQTEDINAIYLVPTYAMNPPVVDIIVRLSSLEVYMYQELGMGQIDWESEVYNVWKPEGDVEAITDFVKCLSEIDWLTISADMDQKASIKKFAELYSMHHLQ